MTAQEVVGFFASERRTVLLGGMAVILHGLSRNTKDYDIWLDPLPDDRISAFGGVATDQRCGCSWVGSEDRLIRIAGSREA